jgi:uncharacterized protein (UPF0332 family)
MQIQRIRKTENFIKDAELLFINKRFDSCVSRCYYTIYHTLIALLEKRGVKSCDWGHKFVLGEFANQYIHRRKIFPRDFLNIVYEIRKERNEADYKVEQKSEKKAKRVLDKTKYLYNNIIGEIKNEK